MEAAYNLGRLYIFTTTFYCDFNLGREELLKAAKLGSGDAYNLLGCIEYKGFKVKRDYGQALKYFQEAERLANPAALNNLAWLYQHGYGVPVHLSRRSNIIPAPRKPVIPAPSAISVTCIFKASGWKKTSPSPVNCSSSRSPRATPPPCSTSRSCIWTRNTVTTMPTARRRSSRSVPSPASRRPGNCSKCSNLNKSRVLKLIYHTAALGPIELEYQQPVIRVGSSGNNDLVLAHPSVEAYHCQLVFREEKLLCIPASQPIPPGTDLRTLRGPEYSAGDQLRIGELQFNLAHSASSVAVPATPPQELERENVKTNPPDNVDQTADSGRLLLSTVPRLLSQDGSQAGWLGRKRETLPVPQVQPRSRHRARAPESRFRSQEMNAPHASAPLR